MIVRMLGRIGGGPDGGLVISIVFWERGGEMYCHFWKYLRRISCNWFV